MSTKETEQVDDLDLSKLSEMSTGETTGDEFVISDEESDEEIEEEEDLDEEVVEGQEDVLDDIVEDTETDSMAFLVGEFQTKTGLEFTDEELEKIAELPESLESVSELALITGKKLAEVEREAFYAQNPDLYEAFLYKQANGTLEGFGQQASIPDYSTLDLDEVENQKLIYSKFLELKGNDPETIAELLEVAETKNLLASKAEGASEAVNKFYTKQKEDRIEALKAKAEQESKAAAAIVQEVFSTIDSGEILGIKLNKKEQAEFKEYFTKPVDKEGRTAKEIADANLTVKQELFIEWMKKKGFKEINLTEKPSVDKLKAFKEKAKGRIDPIGDTKKAQEITKNGGDEFDLKALEDLTASLRK